MIQGWQYEERIAELEDELAAANDHIADLGKKVEQAEAELAALKGRRNKADNDSRVEYLKRREAEAERDDFQQRLLDELAKNALTPTGRDRLEQAEAELAALKEQLDAATRWLAAVTQDYDDNGDGIRDMRNVTNDVQRNITRLVACKSRWEGRR